ncbi:thiol peroxidase [Anaerococcus sp. AGMB00486]|uniref:Thiol peroxidase n=2 Tax=Anaerococcus TaxID=165779 RepID=A0ABX2N6X8_9FIRM|nr:MULTISPECIES: thiol peroxidase [Anaerococcus]MSS77067.1 thiol peroxidase [Anaerococcus porci]NVF10443.1 thiol peroxidase [Anaerococcus faecalis]
MTERKKKFGEEIVTVIGDELNIGDTAPNFKAINNDLSEYDFYKEEEGKIKIISVVPSLDTSVCEIQTTKFNQAAADISPDVVIVTISNDLPFAQERFCSAKGIDQVKTVSDYNYLDFADKYGTLIKELKLQNRAVFVIDKDNKLVHIEYLEQNTSLPDYKAAIEAAKNLI